MSDAVNYETLSDEDFMSSAAPVDPADDVVTDPSLDPDHTTPKQTEAEEEVLKDLPAPAAEEDTDPEDKPAVEDLADTAEDGEEKDDDDPDDKDGDDAFKGDAPKPKAKAEADPDKAKADPAADPDKKAETVKEEAVAPPVVNYEAEYNKLMAPFKANGKDFKVASPDEAIRLMQMGANYNKKMQALAPNMKLMRMLDNNDLLTEDKITFLIDLNEKNPAAIQKLLHEGKIDPMDIDSSAEPAYEKGNHAVSDQEMSFHDVLEEVTSTPTGKETVQLIDKTWDKDSKAAVFNDPSVLKIIDTQRENGIYAMITDEIDRQTTLGKIPANTPFIEVYRSVGDQLHQQGKFGPTPAPVEEPVVVADKAAEVLETRTATRKPAASNSEKAKAASPVKSTAPVTSPAFDPMSMTDEQVMAFTPPSSG